MKDFAKIKDPRNPNKITHKKTVLMMYGLFMFVFRLSSRREGNLELTRPCFSQKLRELFPEIDTVPHADTIARLLERIDPKEIEKIHISLITDLIKQKKFKKLLIQGCLPISIDGTQKLTRDGLLNNESWLERQFGDESNEQNQQYVYVIEANITLQNNLTIPLLTEYLFTDVNVDENEGYQLKAGQFCTKNNQR